MRRLPDCQGMKAVAIGGRVSPSRAPVPQRALCSRRRPSLPVAGRGGALRRRREPRLGTTYWRCYGQNTYSIVSDFGTRGPPSGRWTARIRPTGGSRFTLIRLSLRSSWSASKARSSGVGEGRMVGARDGLCCVPHSCEGPLAPVCGKTAPPDRVQAAHRIGCRLNWPTR
jgi:hypothetical protein